MSEDVVNADRLLESLDAFGELPVPLVAGIDVGGTETIATKHAKVNSRFEFGSIGKTMTTQVLASLVVDGTVTLDDPIGRWLNAGSNGSITLVELATHTSGLPRMAANAGDGEGFDPLDPFAAYTAELAEAAVRDVSLSADRSSVYSNFGYQLLGVALGRAAKTTFADLLAARVFEPFGLTNASVGPGPNQVQGYAAGKPTPAWHITLAGPGGVAGTIADLLAWGRAALDPPPGPDGEALRLALEPRVPAAGGMVGLGWHHLEDGVIWHNGGTYGARSCLAINGATRMVAASIAATGDLQHGDQATFLAVNGRDPVDARPSPAGDEHHAAATAFVDALVAHRWADAQEMMTASCRAALTVERISDAWAEVMEPRGAYSASTVSGAAAQGGFTQVTVDLTFSDGTGVTMVSFDADGRVAGVRIA